MIKEKFLNLVNACKNDSEMLEIIESDMKALGEYVYAVHMMETSIPIIHINYEGEELRDRVEKLDRNRRDHHDRAIMGVKRLNRFAEMEGVEKSLRVILKTDMRLLISAEMLPLKYLTTELVIVSPLSAQSKYLTMSRKEIKITAEREIKNMPNNIKFVAERKSKFLTTKEYHGYGQILKISDDGVDKHIIVKPIDPVFGVTIKFLESDNPCFAVPDISMDDTAIILKNLEEAREFYEEFCKRRDEFI